MSKRIKRRTLCGRPVKGKIKWFPLNPFKGAATLYFVFAVTGGGIVPRFYTGQLGVDQAGRLTDALYRTVELPEECVGDPREYIAVVNLNVDSGSDFKAVGQQTADSANRHIAENSPWFVPAGVQRGQVHPIEEIGHE